MLNPYLLAIRLYGTPSGQDPDRVRVRRASFANPILAMSCLENVIRATSGVVAWSIQGPGEPADRFEFSGVAVPKAVGVRLKVKPRRRPTKPDAE